MVRGKCNCGTISYEVEGDLTGVIVCHCSICRRATGSNGIAVVIVDNSGFKWTGGEGHITAWKKPDADWAMSFCRSCGSPVPAPNDDSRMFVPAGSISDGGDDLTVTDHIWVDSKAAWDEIGDVGRCHLEAFEK